MDSSIQSVLQQDTKAEKSLLSVWAIMATCGRHTLSERSLRMFLNQDYGGEHALLIYNNSPVKQGLGEFNLSKGKDVVLMNRPTDLETGEPYNNLGAIYRDALSFVPDHIDIVIFWDDDDLFLPNHITSGVEGVLRAREQGKIAYKPAQSYYRHAGGIQLMSNTLEPSFFVPLAHLREHGFHQSTSDQHLKWVDPLVYGENVLVDDKGKPTLIYNWGDVEIPTFKTSGNAGNPNNFTNYRNFSTDHGDQVITPWSTERIQKYYNLVQ
jgi:hypothetical protein